MRVTCIITDDSSSITYVDIKDEFQNCSNCFFTSVYQGYKLSYTIHITIQAADGFNCGIEVNIQSIYQLNEVVVCLLPFIIIKYYFKLRYLPIRHSKGHRHYSEMGNDVHMLTHHLLSLFLISGQNIVFLATTCIDGEKIISLQNPILLLILFWVTII